MGFLAFLIAVAALFVAVLAYKRSGGSRENLEQELDALRRKTADALARMEKSVRGESRMED